MGVTTSSAISSSIPTLSLPPAASGLSLTSATATATVPPNVDFGPSCDFTPSSCPACDGLSFFEIQRNRQYTIHCNQSISAYGPVVIVPAGNNSGQPELAAQQCVDACDSRPGCRAVTAVNETDCYLSIDGGSLLSVPPSIVYVRSDSSSSMTSTTAPWLGLPTYAPFCPWENPRFDFACPDCDQVQISNSAGEMYKSKCWTFLYSASSHTVQQDVGINECLLECDGHPLCVGANHMDGTTCILAFGIGYRTESASTWNGFVRMRGAIDPFVPPLRSTPAFPWLTESLVPSSTDSFPDWHSMSAFPTGAFTSLSTAGPSSAIPSAGSSFCAATEPSCDNCDGRLIADQSGDRFRLSCRRGVTCRGQADVYDGISLRSCVSKCNQDLNCVGGTWAAYGMADFCSLCRGRPAVDNTSEGGGISFFVDYAVVPDQVIAPTSFPEFLSPSSLIGSPPTPASSTAWTTITQSSRAAATSVASSVPDAIALQCPASNGVLHSFALLDSQYRILCNVMPSSSGAIYGTAPCYSLTQCAQTCHNCWAFAWNSNDESCIVLSPPWNPFQTIPDNDPATVYASVGVTAALKYSATSDPGIVTKTRSWASVQAPSDGSTVSVPTGPIAVPQALSATNG